MPHVLANRAYAKHCLVKRPFETKEGASSDRPEDFDVYRCRYCKKWHRTSKRHLKYRIQLQEKQARTKRRIKALKRRDFIKSYQEL